MIRYAIIRNARSRREVDAYLPGNYRVVHEFQEEARAGAHYGTALAFVIEGKDDHGWGLESYVIPRLASGLIACKEIDLSHPIMKEVPLEPRSPRP